MPFPLLGLLPSILRSVAKVTGISVVGDAADAITKAQLTPEQQAELQDQLLRHEQAMKALGLEELKTAVSESVAMIGSGDKFVSRARPSMLYAATGITILLCFAVFYAIVSSVKLDLGVFAAITSLLVPLWGASGYYIGQRTKEKLGRNGNSE